MNEWGHQAEQTDGSFAPNRINRLRVKHPVQFRLVSGDSGIDRCRDAFNDLARSLRGEILLYNAPTRSMCAVRRIFPFILFPHVSFGVRPSTPAHPFKVRCCSQCMASRRESGRRRWLCTFACPGFLVSEDGQRRWLQRFVGNPIHAISVDAYRTVLKQDYLFGKRRMSAPSALGSVKASNCVPVKSRGSWSISAQ